MIRMKPVALAVALLGAQLPLTASANPDMSGMFSILESMSDNSWSRLNLNSFLDVAPDPALRAMPGSSYASLPQSVIYAWSGFAWDSQRGDLIIYGGGHANYAGNEVYRFSGTTMRWELASLPSAVEKIPNFRGEGNFVPVDGALNAPPSAHTYDNTSYLPIADRVLMLGGAAFQSGGAYTLQVDATTSRATGPYFWDPSKADGTKVGGTTGSGVDPSTPGGEMWQNRDLAGNNAITAPGIDLGYFSNVEGTSAVTQEGGKDVVYFTARLGGGTSSTLFRYEVADVADPSLDRISIAGTNFNAPNAVGAAGYDPISKLYVAVGGTAFVGWDLDVQGAANRSAAIAPTIIGGGTFESSQFTGIDWDPMRGVWLVWGGGGDVWALDAPDAGTLAGEWTLELIADGTSFADGQKPAELVSTGVLGKWKYASNLDAFIALEDSGNGNVWVYRPEGWTNPVPIPEPETYAMFLLGLGVLAASRRYRRTA